MNFVLKSCDCKFGTIKSGGTLSLPFWHDIIHSQGSSILHCIYVVLRCSYWNSISAPTPALQYCINFNKRCSVLRWVVVENGWYIGNAAGFLWSMNGASKLASRFIDKYFLFAGWSRLSTWTTKGEMWNHGISSKHRPWRQCVPQYIEVSW